MARRYLQDPPLWIYLRLRNLVNFKHQSKLSSMYILKKLFFVAGTYNLDLAGSLIV